MFFLRKSGFKFAIHAQYVSIFQRQIFILKKGNKEKKGSFRSATHDFWISGLSASSYVFFYKGQLRNFNLKRPRRDESTKFNDHHMLFFPWGNANLGSPKQHA